MSIHPYARRRFMSLLLAAPFWGSALMADAESSAEALITEFEARPDGATMNTKAIQAVVEQPTKCVPRVLMFPCCHARGFDFRTEAPEPFIISRLQAIFHPVADAERVAAAVYSGSSVQRQQRLDLSDGLEC